MPDINPLYGAAPKEKQRLGSRDRQLLLFLVAAVFAIIAIALFTTVQMNRNGGTGTGNSSQLSAQSCSGYLYATDYYKCIGNVAIKSHNASVCGVLPADGQYTCLNNLAQNSSNIAVCSGINESSNKYYQCVSSLLPQSQDLSYCSTFIFPISVQCIYNISAISGFSNLAACSAIKNISDSKACNSLYYYKKAVSSKSANYCSYLNNSRNNAALYIITVNSSTDSMVQTSPNFLFSRMLGLNFTPNGYCNYQVAVASNNETLCGKINNGTYASALCTYYFHPVNITQPSINFSAKNVSMACKPFNNSAICNFTYYTNRAVNLDNETDCLLVPPNQGRDLCIESLVYKYRNSAYCTDIVNATLRSECINATEIAGFFNITSLNVTFNQTPRIP